MAYGTAGRGTGHVHRLAGRLPRLIVRLHLEKTGDLTAVRCDGLRIAQVVHNLVSNAR